MIGSLQEFSSLFSIVRPSAMDLSMPSDFFSFDGGAKSGFYFATRGNAKRQQRAAQKRRNLRMRKG